MEVLKGFRASEESPRWGRRALKIAGVHGHAWFLAWRIENVCRSGRGRDPLWESRRLGPWMVILAEGKLFNRVRGNWIGGAIRVARAVDL